MRKKSSASIPAQRACALLAAIALLAMSAVSTRRVCAQESSKPGSELTVSASFADQPVAADTPIAFRVNRPLRKTEGSLAIVIGQSDLTALFNVTETVWQYDAKSFPLPMGESVVTVYLVSPDHQWQELARFTLRIAAAKTETQTDQQPPKDQAASAAASPPPDSQPGPTAPSSSQKKSGFDKLDFIPSITLSLNSQPAQATFPLANRPERATFTDGNLQLSFRSNMSRGLFESQNQFDFIGASFQPAALRFGQLGEKAPQIDLSSYLLQAKVGKVSLQSGHFSYGLNRHLMNNFSSRGVMLSLPLGKRGDLAFSAMNGTSIVGYSNFLGIEKSRHRLLSATLGLEVLPKRPGGLRLEVTGLNGWLQPVNSFSQGSVNDAERSRGMGLRLIATDPTQRLRLDAGFARSQFTSPADPLLDQGRQVKQLPSITRNAHYLDVSYELLRNVALTADKSVNLSVNFRHERIEPLYRSLGASTGADKVSNDFALSGSIGDFSAQFSHGRFHDNLNDIPSILKSLTRGNNLSLAMPIASLLGKTQKPREWLPRVSYSVNRTHQFGAAIPVGGGFELDLGAIPDQMGTNHAINADWQLQKWRVGYRFNRSLQDNRQPQSASADFAGLTNGIGVGISPTSALDLNFELNAESAEDRASQAIDRTLRFAPTINWRMTAKSALASNCSITLAGDEAGTKRNRNVEFDVQWSYRFGWEKDRFRKVQGQFFIRYANRYGRARNRLFDLNDLQKTQIVNLGLSFTFF